MESKIVGEQQNISKPEATHLKRVPSIYAQVFLFRSVS